MWKKNESDPDSTVESAPRPQKAAAPSPSPAPRPRSQPATIGPSISIKGDISGDEDLLIEGRVEGAIQLRKNDVTVGTSGRVVADIHGKRICVDGEVTGDLMGDEVLIRKSGRVEGNAKAPRVMLENGCHFRGSIDMKPANDAAPEVARSAPPRSPARRSAS